MRQLSNLNKQIQARPKTVEAHAATASADRLSEATHDLPAAELRLQADQKEQNALIANGQRAILNDAGLQAHLQAFSQEVGASQTLSEAALTVFLLFLLIQLLPILVKTLLNLGPQNTYEKMVVYEEESWLRAAREDIARRQAKRQLE